MKFLASSFKRLIGKHESVRVHTPKAPRHPIDVWLLGVTLVLAALGILMVYDSSVALAIRDFSDQYYFAREQAQWFLLGFLALAIVSKIDYHVWYALALPMLFGVILLLLLVFVPGIGIQALGARRWINLGFFVLQPAEVAKLALVVYLSAWFSHPEKNRLWPFLFLLTMIAGLVVLEPDLGTAVIHMGLSLAMYFYSGAAMWQLLLLVPPVAAGTLGLALVSPYRFRRLTTFFNPQSDPLGASYQIRQVLLALGSGGLFGLGIGKSRQKYEYLPEANTDSIFAIIGEELGFIGATVVILLFLFLLWRGFRIARRAPDAFGRLLALGIATWIGIQTAINLGAMVALVPLTGVPLPFISYGGSSMIVLLVGIGILLNISKHRNAR